MKLKILIIGVLGLLLIVPGVVLAGSIPSDCVGKPCDDAVRTLLQYEIVSLDGKGEYRPDEPVMRGEMARVAILSQGLGAAVAEHPEKTGFRDISPDDQAAGYVCLAAEEGLVCGYEDGAFQAEKPVTWPEMITITMRALGVQRSSQGHDWTGPYVTKAIEMGLIKNKPQRRAAVTRGEMAIFINKLIQAETYSQNNHRKRTLKESLLAQNYKTEHFLFYSTERDCGVLNELAGTLEKDYSRITADLACSPPNRTEVRVYPDIDTFHRAVGSPDAPDWAIACVKSGKIHMVTPGNPGPVHNYTSVVNSVNHEFTHIVERGLNPGHLPTWLNEGVALYEGKNAGDYYQTISEDIAANRVPSLEALGTRESFSANKGEEWSAAMVEFIVDRFGREKLVQLIRNPENTMEALGLSQEELYTRWISYVKDRVSK